MLNRHFYYFSLSFYGIAASNTKIQFFPSSLDEYAKQVKMNIGDMLWEVFRLDQIFGIENLSSVSEEKSVEAKNDRAEKQKNISPKPSTRIPSQQMKNHPKFSGPCSRCGNSEAVKSCTDFKTSSWQWILTQEGGYKMEKAPHILCECNSGFAENNSVCEDRRNKNLCDAFSHARSVNPLKCQNGGFCEQGYHPEDPDYTFDNNRGYGNYGIYCVCPESFSGEYCEIFSGEDENDIHEVSPVRSLEAVATTVFPIPQAKMPSQNSKTGLDLLCDERSHHYFLKLDANKMSYISNFPHENFYFKEINDSSNSFYIDLESKVPNTSSQIWKDRWNMIPKKTLSWDLSNKISKLTRKDSSSKNQVWSIEEFPSSDDQQNLDCLDDKDYTFVVIHPAEDENLVLTENVTDHLMLVEKSKLKDYSAYIWKVRKSQIVRNGEQPESENSSDAVIKTNQKFLSRIGR